MASECIIARQDDLFLSREKLDTLSVRRTPIVRAPGTKVPPLLSRRLSDKYTHLRHTLRHITSVSFQVYVEIVRG